METKPHIPETPSDESIHALQEELDDVLPQWVIDMIEGTQPDFWWVY